MRNRPRKTARRCASPEQRLHAHLTPAASGCLEWNGGKGRTGYGNIKIAGKRVSAHRVAWEIARGEIPRGMSVLHRCDNRSCCNPEHLFLGTQPENLADMRAKQRHKNPPRPRMKLPARIICSVCERYAAGASQQQLADELGVSQPTISRVIIDHRRRQHACE